MSTTYRRFIVENALITRSGNTFLQTFINFPLLGWDEPRDPIYVFEGPANTEDEKPRPRRKA